MTQLIRQGDAVAGAVTAISLATLYRGIAVTAVRDGSGNLKLIAWQVSQDTQGQLAGGAHVIRKGDAAGGAISKVAITASEDKNGNYTAITAVRDGSDHLKIIAWKVASDGSKITRKGEAAAGSISDVAIGELTTNLFVTVVRTGGDLKLIAWHISDDANTITRKGEATGGAVSRVTIVPTGPNPRDSLLTPAQSLVTALEKGDGNLKVIAWQVSSDGSTITRKGEASAGSVSEVSALWYGALEQTNTTNERNLVATAVQTGGKLKIIAWSESLDVVQQIVRLYDITGDTLSKIATTTIGTEFTGDRIVAAGKDNDGNLVLSLWNWDSPTGFTLDGSASAGATSDVALGTVWSYYLVTAVRTGSGDLKVIAWQHL
jgi:WD40 repeat protein